MATSISDFTSLSRKATPTDSTGLSFRLCNSKWNFKMHASSFLQSCKTCLLPNNLVTEACERNNWISELLITIAVWWGRPFSVLTAYRSPGALVEMPIVIEWARHGAWGSGSKGLRGWECCQSLVFTWSGTDQHMATHMSYCPQPASSRSGI